MTKPFSNTAGRTLCLLTIGMLEVLVASSLTPRTSRAQSSAALDSAKTAVELLNYSKARSFLTRFVDQPAGATSRELARAHLLLGIVDYSENQTEAARANFTSAMQLDPSTKPDPLAVSPKIVEFFESVRENVAVRPQEVQTRYVTLADPRPAAALRSMVVPGWGQLYKGHKGKAIVAGSAWVATLGGTAIAHRSRNRARRLYLDETDPALVSDRYAVFNDRQKLRNTLAVSAAAVWLLSYIDAIATPGRSVIAPVNLSVSPTGDGASFAIVWRMGE
jgi:hypothetical protein